jgi:hypothetical protein
MTSYGLENWTLTTVKTCCADFTHPLYPHKLFCSSDVALSPHNRQFEAKPSHIFTQSP